MSKRSALRKFGLMVAIVAGVVVVAGLFALDVVLAIMFGTWVDATWPVGGTGGAGMVAGFFGFIVLVLAEGLGGYFIWAVVTDEY